MDCQNILLETNLFINSTNNSINMVLILCIIKNFLVKKFEKILPYNI